jgi:hypothetical protein
VVSALAMVITGIISGNVDVSEGQIRGSQMPRKKETDKTPVKKPRISDTADISALEEQPMPRRRSRKKTEDIPFAEVLPERGSDDDYMDVPHFSKTDESPIISADEADALDVAIEEARSYKQPLQDQPSHDYIHAGEPVVQENNTSEAQPAPEIIHSLQIFPSEVAEVASPPLMIFGFAVIMLIYILAST